MSAPGPRALLAIFLAVLGATPVLLPLSQPPIVTAVAELWAVAVAGVVALALGARAWAIAPLRVAGFGGEAGAPSMAPQILLGTAALAGLLSALIALLQVLAPDVVQGPLASWMEATHLPGRAVGHMRQPNHLATVLLWGAVGWAVVAAQADVGRAVSVAGLSLLTWALVLTGSRTGLLGLSVMVGWGLMDRHLPRHVRAALMATPLMAAVAWGLTHLISQMGGLAFGAASHLQATAGGDISSSRFAIWRNTWQLILEHPWAGVGWGNFNIAWTLTPMTSRPTALFDHAHNLPLHLMAEWGIPVGLLMSAAVCGLTLGALRRVFGRRAFGRRAFGRRPAVGTASTASSPVDTPRQDHQWRRAACVMVLIVGLHSLLEYPLWYTYFALPALAALAVALEWDCPQPRAARWQALILMVLGVGLLLTSVWAYRDYRVITAIYAPPAKSGPLAARMAKGQAATWFTDHAHYAVATNIKAPTEQPWPAELERAFERAPHVLLDARLMMAWARALAARNGPDDLDKARYLAARLREFDPPAARPWWGACEATSPPPEIPGYPCEAPQGQWTWRDFVRP